MLLVERLCLSEAVQKEARSSRFLDFPPTHHSNCNPFISQLTNRSSRSSIDHHLAHQVPGSSSQVEVRAGLLP